MLIQYVYGRVRLRQSQLFLHCFWTWYLNWSFDLCFPSTMCHILDTFSSQSHAWTSAHIPCVISHIAIHIMHDVSFLRYSLFSGRSRYFVLDFLTSSTMNWLNFEYPLFGRNCRFWRCCRWHSCFGRLFDPRVPASRLRFLGACTGVFGDSRHSNHSQNIEQFFYRNWLF